MSTRKRIKQILNSTEVDYDFTIKGWVRSFCPKLITIERYPSKGPFMSEFEMKAVLSNAKSN